MAPAHAFIGEEVTSPAALQLPFEAAVTTSVLTHRLLVALLLLTVLLRVDGQGQIKFVQITDPHLYDGYFYNENNELIGEAEQRSLEIFEKCISKIKELNQNGDNYRFAVVTGDLGVERIVTDVGGDADLNVLIKDQKLRTKISNAIKAKAEFLAGLIDNSSVPLWLFVPGNNDLVKEQPNSIVFYNEFIAALRESLNVRPHKITVKNLCPGDAAAKAGQICVAHNENEYLFVGFNNAAFKNDNDYKRFNADLVKYVDDVKLLVDSNVKGEIKYAYVFYHVPEVDDPYLALGTPDRRFTDTIRQRLEVWPLPKQGKKPPEKFYLYSSWYVSPTVRASWEGVAADPRIKGLFAGHFHDWRRETYLNHQWIRTTYPGETLAKLHVCPPLSGKFQNGRSETARGFQEVIIDKTGMVLDERGQKGINVYWLDPGSGDFRNRLSEGDAEEAELRKQLENGQSLERAGRLEEAEAAYTQALASKVPATRQAASESLARVRNAGRTPMPQAIVLTLSLLGAFSFGIVLGWVTYGILRRSQRNSLTDISTVIGAVAGAAVTVLFPLETGAFGAYCIGLMVGFFLYLWRATKPAAPDWLGEQASEAREARLAGRAAGRGGQDLP